MYSVPFEVASGTSAGVMKTAAAVHVPAASGEKIRLVGVDVGFAAATPPDTDAELEVNRILDVSAGSAGTPGSTIAAADVPKADDGDPNSPAPGTVNYGTEPSTYQTDALWTIGLNAHGAISKVFPKPIVAGDDQLVALRVAPSGTTAVTIRGTLHFERV